MSYCIICKVPYGCVDDVTLHQVPKSEEIRAKWAAVIKKNLSKYTKVCCDHFKNDDLFYKVNKNGQIKRHIKYGAVPVHEKIREKIPENNNGNLDSDDEAVPELEFVKEEISSLQNLYENEPERQLNIGEDSIFYNTEISRNIPNNLRKQACKIDNSQKKVRTIRFIGDLCRIDFTSDEAFEFLNKFIRKNSALIKSLKGQNKRLQKNVDRYQNLVHDLKEKGLVSATDIKNLQLNNKNITQKKVTVKKKSPLKKSLKQNSNPKEVNETAEISRHEIDHNYSGSVDV